MIFCIKSISKVWRVCKLYWGRVADEQIRKYVWSGLQGQFETDYSRIVANVIGVIASPFCGQFWTLTHATRLALYINYNVIL